MFFQPPQTDLTSIIANGSWTCLLENCFVDTRNLFISQQQHRHVIPFKLTSHSSHLVRSCVDGHVRSKTNLAFKCFPSNCVNRQNGNDKVEDFWWFQIFFTWDKEIFCSAVEIFFARSLMYRKQEMWINMTWFVRFSTLHRVRRLRWRWAGKTTQSNKLPEIFFFTCLKFYIKNTRRWARWIFGWE